MKKIYIIAIATILLSGVSYVVASPSSLNFKQTNEVGSTTFSIKDNGDVEILGNLTVESCTGCGGGSSSNPKIYRALISQSGTNAPIATILENTLGVTPTWGYNDVGSYSICSTNAFPYNKTIKYAIIASNGNIFSNHEINGQPDCIDYSANSPEDDILNRTAVEILVYP